MSGMDEEFQRYFEALDRAGGEDRCYLCRRTSADVKAFFGFDEDGVPTRAAEFGLEDVVFEKTDVMSYRGHRPVCTICQLNFETLFLLGEERHVEQVLREIREEREKLWPEPPGRTDPPPPAG